MSPASTTSVGFPIAYQATCVWGHKGGVFTATDLKPCTAQAERRVAVGLPAQGKAKALELCSIHLRIVLEDAEASGAIVQ